VKGIVANLYYRWSNEFLEAGKKRLMGDTQREATSTEVTDLRKDVSRQRKSSQRRFLKTVCSKKA
jgi:transposase